MKITNEQIQAILEGAEKFGRFVDHYDFDTDQYLPNGTESRLSDLREILELRQEVERLKGERGEVAAKAVEDAADSVNGKTFGHNGSGGYFDGIDACIKYLHRYANQLLEQDNEK